MTALEGSRSGEETSWSLIGSAARGDRESRAEFVRRYLPAVRAYLSARWANGRGEHDIEDAVQEVFVECFRQHGVLEAASRGDVEGFRAYLHGVVRNVALQVERRAARRAVAEQRADTRVFENTCADESSLSGIFDRAWAESILQRAAALMGERARAADEREQRRFELLRLRFQEDLSMARIAQIWGIPPDKLQYEYGRARLEFLAAIREIVGELHPGSPEATERVCRELAEQLER